MPYRRNIFAKIRTLMATERTLMSYYRTAITLLGVSVFIYKFYEKPLFVGIAFVFLGLSIGLGIFGTIKYFNTRKKIKKR